MPTAKPPIQSSPSGLMKSARHMFGRPSRFFTCWRRKGSAGPVVAGEHEDVVALALAAPQADRRLGRHPALGDDLVEHRLRVVEQAARAFADDRIVEDRGIVAGQLPRAEERRPVDRRAADRASGHSPNWCRPGIARRRRLARRIEGEAVGARFVERRKFALAAALARLARACHNRRRCSRSAARAACPTPATRRRRPRGWRRGRGSPGPRRPGRCAARYAPCWWSRRRSAAASSGPARCISPATVTISSSDGVIRPERPIMSALIVVRGFQDVLPRHHHAEVDDLEAVALQDDADDVLADVVNVALDGRHHDPALALGRAGRSPSPPR